MKWAKEDVTELMPKSRWRWARQKGEKMADQVYEFKQVTDILVLNDEQFDRF
ncbi:Uncharacterised protein [Rodentibacter pneumotropicus]|uniref:Uncharacterized protein n=1 Tax=Rodentibacter pneumotropicus TaxID=758 RepID=A0A448MK18_9PAST|nr:Uncharacterised protein [Rodentibacter pneumotropicus]